MNDTILFLLIRKQQTLHMAPVCKELHNQTRNTGQFLAIHPGGEPRLPSRSAQATPVTTGCCCTVGHTWHTTAKSITEAPTCGAGCDTSAVDTGDTVTTMQLLPRAQQPLSAILSRLTLPEQEHLCHPIPPAPNTSSRSTDSDTIIYDSLFTTHITPPAPKYCTSLKKRTRSKLDRQKSSGTTELFRKKTLT